MNRMQALASMTAVALAGLSQLASGAIAYDNLGSSPYNSDGYSSFGLIDGVRYDRGMQFTASQSIYLSTLQLAIGQAYFDGTTLPGTASIELMTDVGNTPGTVLQSWTSSNQSSFSGGVETLTSTSTLALAAGTKYWIMLGDASGSNLGGAWFFADDQDTGDTLVDYVNDSTNLSTYSTLTRGFRTLVSGNPLLLGDANLDGTVDLNDLNIVLNNLGTASSAWTSGNFDGAATIDLNDLNDVLNNLGVKNAIASGDTVVANGSGSTVPEPASLAILAFGTISLLTARRKSTAR